MIEFNFETSGTAGEPSNFSVSVVGIGGSGSSVLDRLALEGMPGAELICMASDVRILNNSMAGRKIQMGPSLTQGLGAGGDPELGLEAAQSSEAELRDLFKGRSMIFICTGLGGGTGSGAAPFVAKLARESGAFVVVFATLPFSFEGRRRTKQAAAALEVLRRQANALVTFENDRMGELILPKKGIQEAFQLADRIIGQSIRAVTSLVTQPGLIRIGMDDLITALRNTDSRCLFGYGLAKGENRALDALSQALKSPLLDRGQMLAKAQNVLVHICGGSNITLFEIETLMRELQKHVNEDAHLLFGAAADAKLGDHISVTLLTSLGKECAVEIPQAPSLAASAPAQAAPAPSAAAPAPPEPAPIAAPPTARTEQKPPVAVQTAPPVVSEQAPAELPVLRIQSPVESPRAIPTPPAEKPARRAAAENPRPAPAKPAAPPPQESWESVETEAEEFFEEEEVQSKPTPPPPAARRSASPAPKPVVEAYDEEEEFTDEAEHYEEEEDEPVAPPPAKKFAIRDILMKSKPEGGNGNSGTPKPQSRPANRPAPQERMAEPPHKPVASASPFKPAAPPPSGKPHAANAQQQTFDERLQNGNRGRFEKTEPTVEEGEDLDVPSFLRRNP
ncbi:MAG: hypothetical protein KA004_17635 [Verrucomicrobiales bacterium]|nr:hypothetical protein [Verrucomicrobiales bacterium]